VGADDAPRRQLVRELAEEMVRTLRSEYTLLVDESSRVNNILGEAADRLRRNFKQIDRSIRSLGPVDDDPDRTQAYEAAYRDAVAALQFDDIVTQIVAHQIERAEVTRDILERMSCVLFDALDSDGRDGRDSRARPDHDGRDGRDSRARPDHEAIVQELRRELDECLSRFSDTHSVLQQDLSVGDTELF